MDAAGYVLASMSAEISSFTAVAEKMRGSLSRLDPAQREEVEQASKLLRRARAGRTLPLTDITARARGDRMTTATRTRAMLAARANDSQDKRHRALEAIRLSRPPGAPVTATAVATAAGVSTWLVYADGVREHVEAARRARLSRTRSRPRRRRLAASRSPRPACAPTSPLPGRKSVSCAPSATNSAAGSASSSAPRSKDPKKPSSSPASRSWRRPPAGSPPSATPAPPRQATPSTASASSKTNSPPPARACAASSGTPTDDQPAPRPAAPTCLTSHTCLNSQNSLSPGTFQDQLQITL